MNIEKQLATMQDLAQGTGTVQQTRGSDTVVLNQLDLPISVSSIADMKNLDTSIFSLARVNTSLTTYVDYIYSESSTEGVKSNVGSGSWLKRGGNSTSGGSTVTESAVSIVDTTDTTIVVDSESANNFYRVSSTEAVTVELRASVKNTLVFFMQDTESQITFSPNPEITLLTPLGTHLYTRNSVGYLLALSSTEWLLGGDIA